MIINPQLFIFSLPSLIYLLVHWHRKTDLRQIWSDLGVSGCRWLDLAWGLAVAALGFLLAQLTYRLVPAQVLLAPGLAMSHYTGWEVNLSTLALILLREGLFTALGEELFFRGLLGGWLVRRLGFIRGNMLQALLFLVPHLLVLLVDTRLWPLLVAPLALGWRLGWLRHRAGNILPGWLAHTLANALSFLLLQP